MLHSSKNSRIGEGWEPTDMYAINARFFTKPTAPPCKILLADTPTVWQTDYKLRQISYDYKSNLSHSTTKSAKMTCLQRRPRSACPSKHSDHSFLSTYRIFHALATHWATAKTDQTGWSECTSFWRICSANTHFCFITTMFIWRRCVMTPDLLQ